jgi:hypothetical protein
MAFGLYTNRVLELLFCMRGGIKANPTLPAAPA